MRDLYTTGLDLKKRRSLPRDFALCVLVVEILSQITNIYEHMNGEVINVLSLDHEIVLRRNNGPAIRVWRSVSLMGSQDRLSHLLSISDGLLCHPNRSVLEWGR
jgi:hypothetical protein